MEAQSSQCRLLLVDGHAYAYRAYYAIRTLSSPEGRPTNAIYGFIKMLSRIQSHLNPTHQYVVWDGGLDAKRMEQLPEYKAQRPPMPESLDEQIEAIASYLQASQIPSLVQEGVEADDWIASMAVRAVSQGAHVVIASADKDFFQLVSDQINLLNPNDKSETPWKPAQVVQKTGVQPEQIVDWLSLIGDAVDNIPGVPGVGAKTATQLLQQFGSVEQIYSRISEVKSERIRASLVAAKPNLQRNQQMIRLRTDMAKSFELSATGAALPDYDRLRILFTQWGFRSLLEQVEARCPLQKELL